MVDLIAAVIVGHEGLRAVAAPFHRATEFARRPNDANQFRIDFAADAEASAGILRDDAHLLGRNFEDAARDSVLDAAPALARAVEGARLGLGIVGGQCRLRLHRARHKAVVDDVDGDALGRAPDQGLDSGRVAVLPMDGDVGAVVIPDDGRMRNPPRAAVSAITGSSSNSTSNRSAASLACSRRFGEHHGDRLADEADSVGRQDAAGAA